MKTNYSIKQWAEDDRPREKLLLKGKNALSDSEILAILLASGYRNKSAVELAQELLHNCDNDLTKLARLSVGELCKIKGIGEAKALSIIAALELGRRKKETATPIRSQITSASAAFELFRPYFMDLQHEEFYVMFLNQANCVIKIERVSQGGIAGTVCDGKVIFKQAIDNQAVSIILAHNHPSGRLVASKEDEQLTKNMTEFGQLIGIQVLDHLIISDYNYLSFAEIN